MSTNSDQRINKKDILRGTRRSAAIGTDNSTRFYIDMSRESIRNADDQPVKDVDKEHEITPPTLKPKPKRFENYSPKKLTVDEIAEKQRLASERKQKHNEKKIEQAKKVSAEAMSFDKRVKPHLEMLQKQQESQEQTSGKKWFSSAIKKK